MRQKPGQLYHPAVELARNYCRVLQKGSQRKMSPRYDFSFLHNDGNEKKGDSEQPDFVVHMCTESSIINKKTCLDYNFDKPLSVKLSTFHLLFGSLVDTCFWNLS
jgi:phosphatidylinositol-3,4,5-trisphosphate 3-phosphatase/dual-specificity protein phosphatase PTEN